MENKPVITPKTRILDLITAYPYLEEILFEISPAFRQLKNPVLRKTVARVTTLKQAALVGGIPVGELVNRLRREAGFEEEAPFTETRTTEKATEIHPDWFKEEKVCTKLDAREMLEKGEHPVGEVLAGLQRLPDGEIYELVVPFYPAPLIDKATGIGFHYHSMQDNSGDFHIYFTRNI